MIILKKQVNKSFIFKTCVLLLFTLLNYSTVAFAQKTQPTIFFPNQSSIKIEMGEYYDPGATSDNTDGTPIEYVSSNTNVAIIDLNGKIRIIGLGITIITATQAESTNFLAALPKEIKLTVQEEQFINFPPIADKTICDIDFSANVTSTPSLYPSYTQNPITYTSSNPSVATISPLGQIHIVGSGTTTITANQKGNDEYIDAEPQSQQLKVLAVCFNINNTFTPNGDGINDLWNIPDLIAFPNCMMRVFNRSGQLVFQSKGYTKAWDGTNNGQQLPFGTYYYMLSLDDKASAKKMSGWITIVR